MAAILSMVSMISTTDMTAVVLMAPARQKAGSSYCMGASRLAAIGDHMATCESIVAPAQGIFADLKVQRLWQAILDLNQCQGRTGRWTGRSREAWILGPTGPALPNYRTNAVPPPRRSAISINVRSAIDANQRRWRRSGS
jgi:hypothetical protein